MPVYEFKCQQCGDTVDVHRSIEDRNENPRCIDCVVPMQRVFQPTDFNMPKLSFERKVHENRKRADALYGKPKGNLDFKRPDKPIQLEEDVDA